MLLSAFPSKETPLVPVSIIANSTAETSAGDTVCEGETHRCEINVKRQRKLAQDRDFQKPVLIADGTFTTNNEADREQTC